jgi:hypothetical protein
MDDALWAIGPTGECGNGDAILERMAVANLDEKVFFTFAYCDRIFPNAVPLSVFLDDFVACVNPVRFKRRLESATEVVFPYHHGPLAKALELGDTLMERNIAHERVLVFRRIS